MSSKKDAKTVKEGNPLRVSFRVIAILLGLIGAVVSVVVIAYIASKRSSEKRKSVSEIPIKAVESNEIVDRNEKPDINPPFVQMEMETQMKEELEKELLLQETMFKKKAGMKKKIVNCMYDLQYKMKGAFKGYMVKKEFKRSLDNCAGEPSNCIRAVMKEVCCQEPEKAVLCYEGSILGVCKLDFEREDPQKPWVFSKFEFSTDFSGKLSNESERKEMLSDLSTHERTIQVTKRLVLDCNTAVLLNKINQGGDVNVLSELIIKKTSNEKLLGACKISFRVQNVLVLEAGAGRLIEGFTGPLRLKKLMVHGPTKADNDEKCKLHPKLIIYGHAGISLSISNGFCALLSRLRADRNIGSFVCKDLHIGPLSKATKRQLLEEMDTGESNLVIDVKETIYLGKNAEFLLLGGEKANTRFFLQPGMHLKRLEVAQYTIRTCFREFKKIDALVIQRNAMKLLALWDISCFGIKKLSVGDWPDRKEKDSPIALSEDDLAAIDKKKICVSEEIYLRKGAGRLKFKLGRNTWWWNYLLSRPICSLKVLHIETGEEIFLEGVGEKEENSNRRSDWIKWEKDIGPGF